MKFTLHYVISVRGNKRSFLINEIKLKRQFFAIFLMLPNITTQYNKIIKNKILKLFNSSIFLSPLDATYVYLCFFSSKWFLYLVTIDECVSL